MKKTVLVMMVVLAGMAAYAQDKQIKEGSILRYNVMPGNEVVQYQMQLEKISPEQVSLGWVSPGGRTGNFIMHKAAIDSATSGYWQPPVSGTTDFESSQAALWMSKKIWNEIQQDKAITYDGVVYKVKSRDTEYAILNGKVRAVCLESASSKIWVLNNPALPVILKTEGNPQLVDVELIAVD
jgi:hypothetical protein